MKPNCSQPGCTEPTHCKGLCKRHYQQQWRTGKPEIVRPNPHGTLEGRFWRYVTKGEPGACWRWTGFCDKDGYGKLRDGEANRPAHVISWEVHFGPVPDGMFVLHSCNNPPCPNPSHLKLGNHQENMQDRIAAGHYATGEQHPMAKFSDQVVQAVREAVGTYEQIAERFGMSESHVGNIRRGDQRR
jgi:hypothetical protein